MMWRKSRARSASDCSTLSFWHTRQRSWSPIASARCSCAGFGSSSPGSLTAWAGPASSSRGRQNAGSSRSRQRLQQRRQGLSHNIVGQPAGPAPAHDAVPCPPDRSPARHRRRNRSPPVPAGRAPCGYTGRRSVAGSPAVASTLVLVGDAPERHPLLLELHQHRCFLHAGDAPGGEEVHQHRAAGGGDVGAGKPGSGRLARQREGRQGLPTSMLGRLCGS